MRSRLVRRSALLAAVWLVASLVGIVPAGLVRVAATDTREGVYEQVAAAPTPGGPAPTGPDEWLRADDGTRTRLQIDAGIARPEPGSRIRVVGSLVGEVFVVQSIEVLQAPPPISRREATRTLLVMLVHWTSPMTLTQQQAISFVNNDVDDWYREVSYGQVGFTGTATPWMALDPSTSCEDYYGLSSRAHSAAIARGYDPDAYDHVMMVFPWDSRCSSWAGLGQVTGRLTWINYYFDERVTIHELGHNLGLWHANSTTCSSDGQPTVEKGTCTEREYGNPFDAMGGNAAYHFNPAFKRGLGWFDGRWQTITTDATVTIAPMEQQAVALQGVELATEVGSYWLEYRRPVGQDADLPTGATDGILVTSWNGQLLYDMRPNTWDDFWDAALPAGATYVTLPHAAITVVSAGAAGATVRVDVRSTIGAACQGRQATIAGAGRIEGTTGDDVIAGSVYGDVITGGQGNDLVCGDAGNDTVVGGAGDDVLRGGLGDDGISGMLGNDSLTGGDGWDRCVQGSGTGAALTCESAVLTLSVSGPWVTEPDAGTAPALFDLWADLPTDQPVTFRARTADGTARAGSDYVALDQIVTMRPNSLTALSAQLAVAVVGDRVAEPDEWFRLLLSDPSAGVSIPASVDAWIEDTDVATLPQITIADASTVEGNSGTKTLRFTVRLSRASSQAVTVRWRTSNGTATAGSDYTAKALTTLRFAAGVTTKTVGVTINGDRAKEANETFSVVLSSPVGATIADDRATGTIRNDD